jgi:NADH:ubiquinone oxidoreductase subunit 3 (subunit A)
VIAFGEEGSPVWRTALGGTALVTVVVFLALLTLAYYYEWRKGTFTWR